MSKTYENLMEAFAGESQANRKYLAFAAQAEKEGCKQAAKMFRAAAEAETIHALAHFRNAKEVKSTAENIQAAIAGETHECVNMYPGMILDAKNEEEMPLPSTSTWSARWKACTPNSTRTWPPIP